MKVGDWEIQDTVSYVYFSSLIFMIICYIVLIVWMTILMHKEIKQPAVDMFKVIQFILIIVCFANCIYTDSCFFWNSYYRTLLARIIYVVLESSLYLYYAVNFLTGYLLIIHIKNLKNLRNGIEYSRCRETIRSIEIKACIVLIISEFFYILLNTLLVVLSCSFELIKEQINRILSGQFCLISLILIVFQAVLYKRLASAMSIDKMIGLYTPYESEALRVIFLSSYILGHTAVFLFIMYNYRGINFKDWIFDLLSGYKLIEEYKHHSLFISSNCFNASKLDYQNMTDQTDDLEEISSSKVISVEVDYEVNDDYMKAYKMNFINSKN